MRWDGWRAAVAGVTLGAAGLASAGDGDLLWSRDVSGEPGLYRGAFAAAATGRLVVVGGSSRVVAGTGAFSLWAFRQSDGAPAWESHLTREAKTLLEVDALAAKGRFVAAAGMTTTDAGGRSFTVTVTDARDGRSVWAHHIDREGNLHDVAWGVAISGRTVVAVGESTGASGDVAFTVRAFDLRSGTLLWEDVHDKEAGLPDSAACVAVAGRRVFVAGTTSTTDGRGAATIRCYDIRDGRLLWEDRYDHEGVGVDGHSYLAVSGGTVFAAGIAWSAAGDFGILARAVRARDGTPVWTDVYDRGGRGVDWPGAIAAGRGLVVVGGRTEVAQRGGLLVRALHARTGAEVWVHHRDRPADATGSDSDRVQHVTIGAKAAYAAGTTGSRDGGAAITVAALSLRDGSEIWARTSDTADQDRAWTATRAGRRLFVSGEVERPGGDWLLPVRAWSVR